jgi:hypothetical protein
LVTKHIAYLTNCVPQGGQPAAATPVVHFDYGRHLLAGPTYQYRFNPENYMQFDGIDFRTAAGTWETVASDSRLLIHADVRNFFTMTFDSHQIESHLEESRLGPVGDMARLSFFLKILLFKIRMSLSTDVGFYADSGHIPMMVNIPVDATSYLHPASGILYSWRLAPAAQAGKADVRMPRLNPSLVRQGYQVLAKTALASCAGGDCFFHYTVEVHGRRFAMDLGIKRQLVERGFFPQFVEDVGRYKETMDWDIDDEPGVRRTGMYFEVSGLQEGGHPWDFWLRLGGQSDPAGGICPLPLHVARVN